MLMLRYGTIFTRRRKLEWCDRKAHRFIVDELYLGFKEARMNRLNKIAQCLYASSVRRSEKLAALF